MSFDAKTFASFHTKAGLERAIVEDTLEIFRGVSINSKGKIMQDIKAGLQLSMLQQLGSGLMESIGRTGRVHASSLHSGWVNAKKKIAGSQISMYGEAIETLIFAPDLDTVDNKPDADFAYSDMIKRAKDFHIERNVNGEVKKVAGNIVANALRKIDKAFKVTFKSSALGKEITMRSKPAGVELKAVTQHNKIKTGSITSELGFDKASPDGTIRTAEQIFNQDILGEKDGKYTETAMEMQKYILFLAIFKLYEKMNTLLLMELERPSDRTGRRKDYIKFKFMTLFHQLLYDKIAPAVQYGLVKIDVVVKDYGQDKSQYTLGVDVSYAFGSGLKKFLQELYGQRRALNQMMSYEKIRAAGIYKYDMTLYSESPNFVDDSFFRPVVYILNKKLGKYIHANAALEQHTKHIYRYKRSKRLREKRLALKKKKRL